MLNWKPWQQFTFLAYLLLLNCVVLGALGFFLLDDDLWRQHPRVAGVPATSPLPPGQVTTPVLSPPAPPVTWQVEVTPTPIPPVNIPPAPLPAPAGETPPVETPQPTSPGPIPVTAVPATALAQLPPTATPTFTPLPTTTEIFTATPLPIATATPTATASSTPTTTPTHTSTATPTATSTPTPRPTATPTSTATPWPTPTPTATSTPTPRPTATPTSTATPRPTATPAPTSTPRPTATTTSTATPQPTATSTPRPTGTPTATSTSTPRPTASSSSRLAIMPTATSTRGHTPTFTPAPTLPGLGQAVTSTPTHTPLPPATHTPTATPSATVTPLPGTAPRPEPTRFVVQEVPPVAVAARVVDLEPGAVPDNPAARPGQPDQPGAGTTGLVKAMPLTNGSIALNWLPVNTSRAYRIYSDMGSGYGIYVYKAQVEQPAFVDQILRPGMAYSYRVTRLEGSREVVLAQTDIATYSGLQGAAETARPARKPTLSVTPAPTALPADAVLLGLRSDNNFTDNFNVLTIAGEVRNDSNLDVGQSDITVTFYDTAGTIIGAASGQTMLKVIPPGEISPFMITLTRPAGLASYSLRAVARPVAPRLSAQLSVVEVRRYEDEAGFFHVKGIIENTGNVTARRTRVAAIIYGRDNRVINVGFTYINPPTLAPGARATYDVIFTYYPRYVEQQVIPFEE